MHQRVAYTGLGTRPGIQVQTAIKEVREPALNNKVFSLAIAVWNGEISSEQAGNSPETEHQDLR